MKLNIFFKISRFILLKSKLLLTILFSLTLFFAFLIHIFTLFYIFNSIKEIPEDYRIAVVFGAKVNKDRSPTLYLKDRLDAAINLYKQNKVDVILLSGEKIHENFNEIDVMEKYILDHGVRLEDTYLDGSGLDTYSTIYRTKNIYKFNNVILISQSYHLSRAIFMGKFIGLDCIGYNADKSSYENEIIQRIREIFANIKALLNIGSDRIPKIIINPKQDHVSN